MELLDLIWNLSQDRDIGQVREQVERMRAERGPRDLKELAEENVELKLRLGLLVRLLISKGVITAEEYAGLIGEARGAKRG